MAGSFRGIRWCRLNVRPYRIVRAVARTIAVIRAIRGLGPMAGKPVSQKRGGMPLDVTTIIAENSDVHVSCLRASTPSAPTVPPGPAHTRLDPPPKRLMRISNAAIPMLLMIALAIAPRLWAESPVQIAAKDLWSVQPVKDVQPPADASHFSEHPIDRFVAAGWRGHGLKPVGPADKRTLIRRAYFDLIGLPPEPGEVAAFLADKSPDAWEKLIDRLLASPAYGERWGRHWLDIVRYADTAGDNSDFPIPQLYKYRNYVIDAFNHDKPYDQFLREQIAGDLLPHKDEAQRREDVIATGYIALSRRFGSQIKNYPQYLTIEDTLDNLGKGILGLTINCARCHDHKYDPISTEDYYALYGIFDSTRYPMPGIELLQAQQDFVPLIPQKEADAILADHKVKVEAEKKKLTDLKNRREQAGRDLSAAIAEQKKTKDDAAKKAIDDKVEKLRDLEHDLGKQYVAQEHALTRVEKEKPRIDDAYAVAEGKTGDANVQIKGQPGDKGPLVPRHFLTALGGQKLPADEKGSGRLELAKWLTEPSNPLTARVMVNRIWQHHFGEGIVATPDDFGSRGKPPTHPELLDYLAKRFMDDGWSIKKMHRLIMTSKVYQLSADDGADNAKTDPANQYLWHANVRRLEAEPIRDAMLAVSGNLDRTPMTTPHPFPDPTQWKYTQHRPFRDVYPSNKRSVYLMTQRGQTHPFMATFDGPDTNACTGDRVASTTALQALYGFNDPFVHEQADSFAQRLIGAAKEDPQRIELAFQTAYARPPSESETSESLAFLDKVTQQYKASGMADNDARLEAWKSLCRVILRSNEFIFVD
ncbi:MAG: DUF1553 domain-containing protein [Planctomycetes bacterium]|nr:DUF1553 domain-containing protein [Planctomycetota bacterium]